MLELLIMVALSSIALTSVVKFFTIQTKRMQGDTFRVEAQQALRASLDAIARDVRLAGACLPMTGAYVPIAATNGTGTSPDSITVRTGIVQGNVTCVWGGVRNPGVNAGSSVIPVDNATGFTVGMLAYLRHPSGSGQYQFVTAVSTAANANTVTLNGTASVAYPTGSGLYAVDERTYAIDSSGATPQLTLTINRGTPQAFAAGITNLQFTYVLNRNCTPCDVVDAPDATDTVTWRLVNSVRVSATAKTVGNLRPEDVVSFTQTAEAKPRNLLP